MVRKCLNGTAADTADLGITQRGNKFAKMNRCQGAWWIMVPWPLEGERDTHNDGKDDGGKM